MRPGWRLWLIMLCTVVLSSIASIYVSVRVASHSAHRQDAHDQQLREEGRAVTCNLVARILAGYEESPPLSEAGKNVVEAWREEYRILGCMPKK
jgi:hypothetical protein